jgi:hypothetical protein
MKNPTKATIWVLVALALGYLAAALRFPLMADGQAGAGLFPVMVAAVLIVSLVATLLRGRPDGGEAAESHQAESTRASESSEQEIRRVGPGRFWILLGTMIGYVVVVDYLGYLLTSALVSWTLLRVLSDRPMRQVVLFAVVLGGASYLVFAVLLGVPLPQGYFL